MLNPIMMKTDTILYLIMTASVVERHDTTVSAIMTARELNIIYELKVIGVNFCIEDIIMTDNVSKRNKITVSIIPTTISYL